MMTVMVMLKGLDKMLAEKDPVAVELYNRFNKVKMPNLRLSDNDVDALINYLDVAGKSATLSKF